MNAAVVFVALRGSVVDTQAVQNRTKEQIVDVAVRQFWTLLRSRAVPQARNSERKFEPETENIVKVVQIMDACMEEQIVNMLRPFEKAMLFMPQRRGAWSYWA